MRFHYRASLELPPRARRIHAACGDCRFDCGTTSACAENTLPQPLVGFVDWNYLRVRGEYYQGLSECAERPELPPRARRIQQVEPTLA